VPVIRERWPSVSRTVGRAARHVGEAQSLLEEIATVDAMGLSDPQRLSVALLRGLDPARQRNVVRAAVTAAGLPAPTTDQLAALLVAIDRARRDAEACVQWPGAEAHLYRDHLHLIAELPAPSRPGASDRVSTSEPWSGPEGDLALVAIETHRAGTALANDCVRDGLDVRFRAGGERLKPAFGDHHRKLKTLFQEHGIVPWMRQRIPLLYRAERLVAVGDLWISDEARAREPDGSGWRVRWTGHPALH
jgi:tRNA(Ile)-lysidine synthase